MGLKSHAEKIRKEAVWLIAAPIAVEALFVGIYFFTTDMQMLFAGCAAGGATFCLLSLALAKRLSDQIRSLQTEIEHAERNVFELQQRNLKMISAMRQEMNDGFTSVGVSLATIADGKLGKLPAGVAKEVQSAERNMTRLSLSTKDLLEWQRIEADGSFIRSLQEIPVASLLDDAVAAGKYLTLQKNISVNMTFSDASSSSVASSASAVKVLGDQNTLTQVMVTLLSNLIQRSKSGDTIEISARDQKDVVEFQLAAPAATLLNAPGGTPDQLDRFDRFDQLFDWPSGASGKGAEELALALCKAAIEAHGGRIGATSKKSDGVAFWFRLPAVVAAAGDAPAVSDESSA